MTNKAKVVVRVDLHCILIYIIIIPIFMEEMTKFPLSLEHIELTNNKQHSTFCVLFLFSFFDKFLSF